ncbi:ABC transporter ATP-binding protein [Algoriphagus boritolerans]|uniref:ABC-2 type transport system ATP-binding protein n=1 Tax=Algoriphagus boritolerans DSM 17298 = JCM 18970 TaxID=1120964 RepID=A0A1H5SXA8_9BACT|nr:ATP-binding cassette domain-containing protein [Algoriphagus boritolerans]SEF55196.1 ABC-2 type transport system ATP-binding protein [Algoriphagus boritolerans DSM 17298 = JCM 18970]
MLQISGLNKSYENHRALTDVDLLVPKGVVFGLLGPNGAGKTTLLRIVNQIIEQDSGTVELDGNKLSPEDIRKIGYLPEERGLYKKMKVWDQLIYFSRLKGLSESEAKIQIKSWLDKLEIDSWRDKKIEDLSKGMAQKVQFIATVVHRPSLLILDEPFSGFDPVNAEIIKNEILELKHKGTTVILSTHRMESVELLCDHLAMINKSRKILDGTVKEIKRSFRPEVFQIVLSQLKKALPVEWTPKRSDDTWEFTLPLAGKSPNELLSEMMDFGEVMTFREQTPSIEEIFIHQVQSAADE